MSSSGLCAVRNIGTFAIVLKMFTIIKKMNFSTEEIALNSPLGISFAINSFYKSIKHIRYLSKLLIVGCCKWLNVAFN